MSEGLGVAGDRLKIGGLGVDQTTFGDHVRKFSKQQVDPKSDTAKPRKGPSQNRVLASGNNNANQRWNKKLTDKNKTD